MVETKKANSRLKLIQGGGRRDRGEQFVCFYCEREESVPTSKLVQYVEWISPVWDAGTLKGGTKKSGWRCAYCGVKVT